MSVNRGVVAVAYEVHESRGKTRNCRRRIDLDATTVEILRAWRAWQHAEREALGRPCRAGCSPTERAAQSIPMPSLRHSSAW